MNINDYTCEAVALLSELIATPSVSREERKAADLLEARLRQWGLSPQREGNNVWCFSNGFSAERPVVLLNAHIDTVRPVASWTRDPFVPSLEGDVLYGLGANDCGGGLVSLLQAFRILNQETTRRPPLTPLRGGELSTPNSKLSTLHSPLSLIFLASCEEEVSGADGIARVLPLLPRVDVAIVGEPTGMQPAVAEKGLMVIDMTARGKSGHAARGEGVNALYQMLDDLCWIRDYRFERVSDFLGPTVMQATVIQAGTQHNVVPDLCKVVIDVRTNELYSNEEVFDIIRRHVRSEVKARSFRLSSSSIATDHPLVRRCIELGKQPFGSPTLSDQALMPFPSLKMGPGNSARSHSADEFIRVSEIRDAIETYLALLRCAK